jgi:hypothetical protein
MAGATPSSLAFSILLWETLLEQADKGEIFVSKKDRASTVRDIKKLKARLAKMENDSSQAKRTA